MKGRTKLEDYMRFPLDYPPVAGTSMDPDSLGYVYIIGFEESGVVKIGSARSVSGRISELQCGNPFELQCKAAVSIYEGNPVHIEMAAHRLAAEHRIRGEWFLLEVEDALRIVIKAARNLKARFGAVIEYFEEREALHRAALDDTSAAEAAEEERRRVLRVKLGME